MPVTGLRFTCTSKTFINMEMQRHCPAGKSSSGGTSAICVDSTRPSAGAMTAIGSLGVIRVGFLKKYTHHRQAGMPIQKKGSKTRPMTSVSATNSPIKGQPAGWIGNSISSRMAEKIFISCYAFSGNSYHSSNVRLISISI